MHLLTRFNTSIVSTLLCTACALGAVGGAQAAAVITMSEVGPNVLLHGSGTANLGDIQVFSKNVASLSVVNPVGPVLLTGPASTSADIYHLLSGPASFGTGGYGLATTGDGDRLGLTFSPTGLLLVLPAGYVSGDDLDGESQFDNQTFSTLGVTEGTFVWTWGSGVNADSLTLRIGDANAVPVPASLALLLIGLAGLGAGRRRGRGG